MYRDSFAAIIRRSDRQHYLVAIGALLGVTFLLSVAFVLLRFPGAHTAPWWPAAGAAVLTALAWRGRGWTIALILVVVTGLANGITGTPWAVALGFGIANAAEAWIIAALVRPRMNDQQAFRAALVTRFLVAAALGAIAAGVIAGAVVQFSGGSIIATAPSVAASHASATLLIGGLGIVPRGSFRVRRPILLTVQSLMLLATLFIAFHRGQGLPLAFLPLPVLAWAAFSFTTGVVLVQVAISSGIVALLSFTGGGPFAAAAAGNPTALVALVQLFTLALGVSMILLGAVQDERSGLMARLSAREQLLRGTIVSAHAGFVLARPGGASALLVVESNPTGERLLASWITHDERGVTLRSDEVVEAARIARRDGQDRELDLEVNGRHLNVHVTPVLEDDDLILIQAIDVSEQRAATQALADALDHEREALARLHDLSQQKDEFISSVSHELRTPVTSILGYAEELELSDLDEDDHKHLEVITRNSRRLADLVDDLLVLSRMTAQPTYSPVAVVLTDAIRECALEVEPLASRSSVTLDRGDTGQPVVVDAEPLWISRVLTNLMSNAIKFTPSGGTVAVRLESASDWVTVTITDSGRGIPPADLERVFERFYRVTDANDGFVPGTGLGLPIVRELVERMGGKVHLESDGHHGTTAVVTLPRHAPASPAPAPQADPERSSLER